MNTKYAKTIFERPTYILVILAVTLLVTASVSTWMAAAQEPEPQPWLIAFPENDVVEGWEWPVGATVSLTINDAPEPIQSGVANVTDWGDSRTFVRLEFSGVHDLREGDKVTLTDGDTTISHTVQKLFINEVNPGSDTIVGTANDGAVVQVWPHGFDQTATVEAIVDEDGLWVANFENVFNLDNGVGGRSQVMDEFGNVTAVDWSIPNPHFIVFPEWEWFDGLDWPDAATVVITVAGKPQCETSRESWGGFFNGNFGEGCDLEIGDIVTFTDGETTRTHVVRKLKITDIDVEANTIAGKAHNDEVIYVWPHSTGQQVEAIADKKGSWQVDFNGVYDLMPGEGGRSEIRDEIGNATALDWYIPRPRFTIYPDAQWFDGIDWPDGDVSIAVEGKPECSFTRQSSGFFFNGGFPEGCFVTAGDYVTFKHGTIVCTHTVRNLAIKIIDKDANTVTGEADSGEQVFVWAWYMDGTTVEGSNTDVTAVDGGWFVNYNDSGIDLALGMGIQAEIRDPDGNATSVDLPVPDPRIVASITENWFYLADFIPEKTLDLSIYDYQGGIQLWNDGLRSTDVNGFAWINFDEHGVDLEPGSYLVVSDGTTTKDLVIEGFTFDVFDLPEGLLMGTAPGPEEGRWVWVGIGFENDGWSMDVLTDPSGNWIADFGASVPVDFTWVAAQVFDQDGDASELRPRRIVGHTMTVGNLSVQWGLFNPEEIVGLSWKGSQNLTNTWQNPYCSGDLEFFGNSWVSENEGSDQFFFASLVGWGTTGTWSQSGLVSDIGSISSGCPGSADIPIHTTYQFFDDEPRANMIEVQRVFDFGEIPYTHDVRPFIPRLYPITEFSLVLHPDASGQVLVTQTTQDCGFGCMNSDWDGSWFAIHNPDTGLGMIIRHVPSDLSIALWLDDDGGSFTNSSSVLLLQPSGGFTGTVTETEYLCFYDSSTWTPSLETLPAGCQP